MKECLNCYNSWICKEKTPTKYDKHKDEDITTCLDWQDDSEDYDE